MRAEAPPRGGSQNLQIPVLNGARPAGFGTRTPPVPLSKPDSAAAHSTQRITQTTIPLFNPPAPLHRQRTAESTDHAGANHGPHHSGPEVASNKVNRFRPNPPRCSRSRIRNNHLCAKSNPTDKKRLHPGTKRPPTNRTNAPPKPETKPRQAVAQKGDTHTPESGTERRRQGPKPAGITPCRPPDKAPNAVKTRFCNSDKICYLCLRIRKSRRGGARKRSPEPAVKASLLTHVDL